MKHIFIGAGSIGQRHIANLRALRSDAEVIIIDPVLNPIDYSHPRRANEDLFADNAIYICSPTEWHYHHFCLAVGYNAHAIFVEKPLFDKKRASFLQSAPLPLIGVGYNYRYHPIFRHIKELANRIIYLHIYGSENIHQKYGVTPLETMLCHSIDLSLWINGKPKASRTHENGAVSIASIRHYNNITSFLHADMASSFRVATCTVLLKTDDTQVEIDKDDSLIVSGGMERQHWFIEPDDQMYIDEMKAWLNYIETGERDPRLCSYEEAVRVQEIMHD